MSLVFLDAVSGQNLIFTYDDAALFHGIFALRVQYMNLGGLLLPKGRGAYHLFKRDRDSHLLWKRAFLVSYWNFRERP